MGWGDRDPGHSRAACGTSGVALSRDGKVQTEQVWGQQEPPVCSHRRLLCVQMQVSGRQEPGEVLLGMSV